MSNNFFLSKITFAIRENKRILHGIIPNFQGKDDRQKNNQTNKGFFNWKKEICQKKYSIF